MGSGIPKRRPIWSPKRMRPRTVLSAPSSPTVALEQAALDGLLGAVGEGEGDRFKDAFIAGQLHGVPPPVLGVHRVGDQEHDAVYGDLGPHDDGEIADVQRADVGRRLEPVLAVLVGRGSYLNVSVVGQRPPLVLVERDVLGE